MNIKALFALSAVTTLTACFSPSTSTSVSSSETNASPATEQTAQAPTSETNASPATKQTAQAPNASTSYVCENGMTVKAQYLQTPQENRVKLSVDTMELSTVLPQAVSGSGERYAGNGFYDKPTEWHEKAGEAAFMFTDPYGNQTETVCRVKK